MESSSRRHQLDGNDISTEAEDIAGICYHAKTGEDTADLEGLASITVIFKLCKSYL